MIFQLFLSWRLCSFSPPSFPFQARESQRRDLWYSSRCHTDRLLGDPSRESCKPALRIRPSTRHLSDFSVSSSWQIIKISQQENWLWFFKVAYNYNAWYLKGVFHFKLFQHIMSPNSIILVVFHYIIIIIILLNCKITCSNNILRRSFYWKILIFSQWSSLSLPWQTVCCTFYDPTLCYSKARTYMVPYKCFFFFLV